MDRPMEYDPPTPAEVSHLLTRLGLTGSQAATLCGLSGSRQIRKYTGGERPRQMAFATLYTLIQRATGIEITPDMWRQDIAHLLEKIESIRHCCRYRLE